VKRICRAFIFNHVKLFAQTVFFLVFGYSCVYSTYWTTVDVITSSTNRRSSYISYCSFWPRFRWSTRRLLFDIAGIRRAAGRWHCASSTWIITRQLLWPTEWCREDMDERNTEGGGFVPCIVNERALCVYVWHAGSVRLYKPPPHSIHHMEETDTCTICWCRIIDSPSR
jgi:hypothetical protein